MGNRADRSGVTVSGEEFRAFLAERDITNADAARVFGVSARAIQIWLSDGIIGTPAHFVAFLIAAKIPPHTVAQLLGLPLSAYWREHAPGPTPG